MSKFTHVKTYLTKVQNKLLIFYFGIQPICTITRQLFSNPYSNYQYYCYSELMLVQIWYSNPWIMHPDAHLPVSMKVAVGRTFRATGIDTVRVHNPFLYWYANMEW
jgi:hypothetical protein